MKLWEARPRQPLIGLALSAVAGILVADRWETPPLWALGFVALGTMAILLRPSTLAAWLLCALAFFELHTLRHYGSEARLLSRDIASGPRVVRATGVVWNEPEKPATWSRDVTARFRLRVESLEIDGTTQPVNVLMNAAWAGAMPAYGDRVSITGAASNLEEKRNPGQFDAAAYQRRQGIYSQVRARFAGDCRIESHGHGNPAQAFAFKSSRWIQNSLALDLEDSPEISDLIASMVLGLRGDTPEEMKALFQRTGTMHLFAVSGLNVAMLAAIILALLKPLGVRRGIAVFVVIPTLVAYALVTGLGASCVRATIMAALVLCAYLLDRRPLPLNSLGASAFAILAWDTNQLYSPGFQFSFVLVVAIVWLAVKIQRRVEPLGRPDAFLPRELWSGPQRVVVWTTEKFAATLGVTLAAWFGSLAFTAGYFHLFSPSAIFANLIAVPLAFVVLVLGVAAILAAGVWKSGAILCNNANWFCAKLLLWVLKAFALIPGGYVYLEVPRLSRAPECACTVLDLGDGGAAFVRARGDDWLLDCGGTGAYDRIVLPYLRSRGVNRLDGLLLTHGDAQHLGAALAAVTDFRPRLIADSTLRDKSTARRRFHDELAARHIGKGLYARGDFIHLGDGATLRVLYPPVGLKRSVADDMALVLQLEAAGTRALFMSDSGFTTEQWLLENEPDLRSDIVIKGQHAKDISGTLDFLARVQPQAVICSALGYGESPAKLDRWQQDVAQRGIAVFRQDRAGAIRIEIREHGFELRGFVNGQTFRSRAR